MHILKLKKKQTQTKNKIDYRGLKNKTKTFFFHKTMNGKQNTSLVKPQVLYLI